MAHTKKFLVSWGNGKWKTYVKTFKDAKHEENWRKMINSKWGVIKDEENINQ